MRKAWIGGSSAFSSKQNIFLAYSCSFGTKTLILKWRNCYFFSCNREIFDITSFTSVWIFLQFFNKDIHYRVKVYKANSQLVALKKDPSWDGRGRRPSHHFLRSHPSSYAFSVVEMDDEGVPPLRRLINMPFTKKKVHIGKNKRS